LVRPSCFRRLLLLGSYTSGLEAKIGLSDSQCARRAHENRRAHASGTKCIGAACTQIDDDSKAMPRREFGSLRGFAPRAVILRRSAFVNASIGCVKFKAKARASLRSFPRGVWPPRVYRVIIAPRMDSSLKSHCGAACKMRLPVKPNAANVRASSQSSVSLPRQIHK
jgi:hypothetical protein